MAQALKALVIGMGILIIIGMALLGYGIYQKTQELVTEEGKPAQSAKPSFGQAKITIPQGCRIVDMKPAGNRLYVRTGPDQSCSRIYVVDVTTGKTLGTLVASP